MRIFGFHTKIFYLYDYFFINNVKIKKIVLSANSSWYLYNFRSSTIQALIKKKYDVICISPRDDYSDKLETMGAAWIDLKMDTNGTNPLKDIILFLELYKK